MRYNVLKITTIMSAMVMIVTLLMVACPEAKPEPQKSGVTLNQEKDKNGKEDGPAVPVLRTLVAPEAVTAPSVTVDTPAKGKIRVTATAPASLGTTDGTPVDAKTIKYALYYARYGHSKDTITIDGGTSIADIAKAVGTPANSDAGMVSITGNTALTTTGFVMPALSEDTIYRYFIRSIHPDDKTKHTNTAARRAFVLNPASTKVIPDTETSIGKDAFKGKALTQVFIPDSVTTIDGGAFADNELTQVFIPDTVTSIGVFAFANNKLTSVTIGNSVTSIGLLAFGGNLLTTVVIPDTVESIGVRAFSHNKLTSVTIGNSVTSIGANAFAFSNLTSVTLSKSLYDTLNGADRLNSTFGAGVTTYQDHAGTKLN